MFKNQKEKPQKEFEEVLLEVRRVTRVTTGGRRMSFRATILIGDKKGKIGLGSAKGADVSIAVRKATHEAYKNIFQAPIAQGNTVPYPVIKKFKSAVVKLLPASKGTGLKAGSSVRSVLEVAGYENMLSKIIGSNNKLNNALATIYALSEYKHYEHFNVSGKKKQEDDQLENTDATDKKSAKETESNKKPTATVKKTESKAKAKPATASKKATAVKKTESKAKAKPTAASKETKTK